MIHLVHCILAYQAMHIKVVLLIVFLQGMLLAFCARYAHMKIMIMTVIKRMITVLFSLWKEDTVIVDMFILVMTVNLIHVSYSAVYTIS